MSHAILNRTQHQDIFEIFAVRIYDGDFKHKLMI